MMNMVYRKLVYTTEANGEIGRNSRYAFFPITTTPL